MPVSLIVGLPRFLVFLFFLALIIRLVFDWVQMFSRDWRPSGVVLVLAEAVYSVTDPPLRLRLGAVQIDLAFTVLFLIVVILLGLLPAG